MELASFSFFSRKEIVSYVFISTFIFLIYYFIIHLYILNIITRFTGCCVSNMEALDDPNICPTTSPDAKKCCPGLVLTLGINNRFVCSINTDNFYKTTPSIINDVFFYYFFSPFLIFFFVVHINNRCFLSPKWE